jgi:prophage tail gpP-like protein
VSYRVPDRLTLKVGGELFEGWKSVSINLGIDRIAGNFSLGLTERWPHNPRDWAIAPGEHCAVLIGDVPVISGYVDESNVSFDADKHDIQVTGRDRTGDLVDCSAPSAAYSGISFVEIARRLVKPYKIEINDEVGIGGSIPKFSIQTGDTVFSTLEKLARQVGVLLVSDGLGGIKITRGGKSGQATDTLEVGQNVLAAEIKHSHAELYSSITVKGQASGASASEYDLSHAAAESSVERKEIGASRRMSGVDRHRPLVIVAETQADAARCRQRAEWEAGSREAKSKKISVTVQGWRQSDGQLWQINQTVQLVAPWLRADGRWLISELNYTLDETGTKTVLTLVGVKAFDSLPEIPASGSGGGGVNNKYKVI